MLRTNNEILRLSVQHGVLHLDYTFTSRLFSRRHAAGDHGRRLRPRPRSRADRRPDRRHAGAHPPSGEVWRRRRSSRSRRRVEGREWLPHMQATVASILMYSGDWVSLLSCRLQNDVRPRCPPKRPLARGGACTVVDRNVIGAMTMCHAEPCGFPARPRTRTDRCGTCLPSGQKPFGGHTVSTGRRADRRQPCTSGKLVACTSTREERAAPLQCIRSEARVLRSLLSLNPGAGPQMTTLICDARQSARR